MIKKDLRALLPLWLACVGTLAFAKVGFVPLVLPAYFLGVGAVGAWGIGHEYNHRTLATLLTLPVPRSRIWLSKLAATGLTLFTIATLGMLVLPRDPQLPFGVAVYYLPAVAALFIAPWLTMASRNPVAGAIFMNSIGAILMLLGSWLGVRWYGYTREVDVFRLQFVCWSVLALSAIAAVDGWRMFARLPAIDGPDPGVHLRLAGRTRTAPSAVRSNVVWLLIRKELRLQQLAWVVAAIYAIGHVAVVVSRRGHYDADDFVTLLAIIHGLVQAMLVGAMASAEERHLGTHDPQLLVPLSSARQWIVKAAAAIGHAELLSIAVPLLLLYVTPVEGLRPFGLKHGLIQPTTIGMVAVLTSVSLYVSAVATSGLRALMLSIPVVLAIAWFVQRMSLRVTWGMYRMHLPLVPPEVFGPLGAVAFAVLIAWRALPHYRWGDTGRLRIAGDVVLLAGALMVYLTVAGALGMR